MQGTQLMIKPEETQAAPVIEHLGVRLDRGLRTASVHGRDLDLTATEFRLLDCLLSQPGRPFTRAELMQAAIHGGAIVLERTIDVHICSLRRKLDSPGLIETARRVGYRFRKNPLPGKSP
jgi:two-component system phosphate regulon response regulator PhoB